MRKNIAHYRNLSRQAYKDLMEAKIQRRNLEKRIVQIKRNKKEQLQKEEQNKKLQLLEQQRKQRLEKENSLKAIEQIRERSFENSKTRSLSNFPRKSSLIGGLLNTSEISSFLQPTKPRFKF